MSDLMKAFKEGSLFKKAGSIDSTNQLVLELDNLGGEGDNRWRMHRAVKVEGDRLVWSFPMTGKDKETKAPVTEITRAHQYVAFRGIYLGSHFGFLFMVEENGKWRNICQTTKIVHHLGENSFTTTDSNPLEVLPFPFQPHKSKSEPTEFNSTLARMPQLELFGSRPPVDYPGDPAEYYGEPRTCQSCVAAQQHMLEPGDFEKPMCRANGYALFCVTELGVIDPNHNMLSKERPKVIFTPVKDCGLVTIDGDETVPLDRPFILRLNGLTKSQTNKIGTGPYERNVILPDQPNSSACYLPMHGQGLSEPMSFGSFWKAANKEIVQLPNGDPAYPFAAEVYIGELRKEEYRVKYVPVFYINKRPDVIAAGPKIMPGDQNPSVLDEWVLTALQIQRMEEAMAGEGTELKLLEEDEEPTPVVVKQAPKPEVKAAAEPEPQVTAVAVVEEEEEVPAQVAAPQAAPARASSSFSAFSALEDDE